MGNVRVVQPVKPIVGITAAQESLIAQARDILTRRYGPIDRESVVVPFTFTDYYRKSMGDGLLRQFISFEKLLPADGIFRLKLESNMIEDEIKRAGTDTVDRPINIDPGYLANGKLVLLTTKDYAHRLYLGEGIHGQVTLVWRDGAFRPLEWTYPDYQAEFSIAFFNDAYERYRRQISN
ncbi:MAG: hypothetical protein A2Z34_00910 [Planctomycetes bacterium RBG_16_59_8]|nr:MAG: hypothetical protein A2Z34_00910 [Planctomycetes bacterium RBG_16_59_8]